jgi:hypothetical protein
VYPLASTCCGRDVDDDVNKPLVLVLVLTALLRVSAKSGTDSTLSKAFATAEAILSATLVIGSLSTSSPSSSGISTDTATAFRAAMNTLDKPSRNAALVIVGRLGGTKIHNKLKKYGKILLYSDSEQSKMHLRSKVESAKLPVDADAIYRYNRRRQT